MENVRRCFMLFIALITLLVVASLIFIINLNLKDEKEFFADNSESLTSKDITSLMKLVEVYDSYIITFDGTKDVKNLTDLEKINFIDRLPLEIKNTLDLDFNKGVSLSKVEAVLKKYFGKDTTFSPVNSKCFLDDGDYLIYDSNTKTYTADNDYHAHGAYEGPLVENYYVEGKRVVDNDKLRYIITLKKAFAYPNTSIYYGNYSDLVNNNNPIIDIYDIDSDYTLDEVNSLLLPYEDEFTSYTYVFETFDSIDNCYLIELANLDSQKEF